MRIGILGSGLMGGKLGTIFARAGHEVVFSYARTDRKLRRLAREAGGNARAGTPADAAHEADALLLAVPWSRVDDVLDQTDKLERGQVVISCMLPTKDTKLLIGHTSSGAEVLARRVRPARFVAAFGTIPSEVLFDVFEGQRRKAERPSLVYYGDDEVAKRVAVRLIHDVGFDPVDAGPLKIARAAEPFTLLIAQLAYEGDRGAELSYRFEWWKKRRGRRSAR